MHFRGQPTVASHSHDLSRRTDAAHAAHVHSIVPDANGGSYDANYARSTCGAYVPMQRDAPMQGLQYADWLARQLVPHTSPPSSEDVEPTKVSAPATRAVPKAKLPSSKAGQKERQASVEQFRLLLTTYDHRVVRAGQWQQ